MKKLYEFLACKRYTGDFGIEIEVEGQNLPDIATPYWTSVPDGSLRNGKEYIFTKPASLELVPKLLHNLKDLFVKSNAILQFSFRTSVHVHMNVQECTTDEVLNIIYTYLLLEAPLMNFCGESRKGNRFCLRMEDAEGLLLQLAHLFQRGDDGIRYLDRDVVRYSALNIEALVKFGSLEFRAMEGTLDIERLTTWCTVLHKIREFATKMKSPDEIYNLYAKQDTLTFMENIFQELSPKFTYENVVGDIQRSFSLSIDLPFSYLQEKKKILKEIKKKEFKEPIEKGKKFVNWEFPPVIVGGLIPTEFRIAVPKRRAAADLIIHDELVGE